MTTSAGRLSHLLSANADAIDPSAADRERDFADREAFRMHKRHAERRGIPFLFTFAEWLDWWKSTGHYEERGRDGGKYVMARNGDAGAYEPGNVHCATVEQNTVEAHLGKTRSPEVRLKIREARQRWSASRRKP